MLKGTSVLHSVNWTDNVNLSGYTFSFDNGTGTFTNDTWVPRIGVSNWTNVTKGINTSVGATIQWMVYTNDSSGNQNVTSTFSYLTTAAPTACWSITGTTLYIPNGCTYYSELGGYIG